MMPISEVMRSSINQYTTLVREINENLIESNRNSSPQRRLTLSADENQVSNDRVEIILQISVKVSKRTIANI